MRVCVRVCVCVCVCFYLDKKGEMRKYGGGSLPPEPLWASTCSLRSEFVTRFCVAPRCLGWRAFVCVKVSALFLQTRGLFHFHTEGSRLIISFEKKKESDYEESVSGIVVKAQFHIHIFESKNLKLKWALNLTPVCHDKMHKKKRDQKIIPILLFCCSCHISYYCSS